MTILCKPFKKPLLELLVTKEITSKVLNKFPSCIDYFAAIELKNAYLKHKRTIKSKINESDSVPISTKIK